MKARNGNQILMVQKQNKTKQNTRKPKYISKPKNDANNFFFSNDTKECVLIPSIQRHTALGK